MPQAASRASSDGEPSEAKSEPESEAQTPEDEDGLRDEKFAADVFSQHVHQRHSGEQEQTIFTGADLDHSGALDFEEFKKMACNQGLSEAKLQDIFDGLDKNKDGTLSYEEFRKYDQAIFLGADLDKSGALDFEEFKKMRSNQGVSEAKLRYIFDGLDVNKDGILSYEEFRKYDTEHHHIDFGWPDPRRWEASSLYIFSLNNPIRKFAIFLCEKGRVDAVLLLAILASTTAMALSDPFDIPERKPESQVRDALELSSLVFSSIFIAEVVLKIIAYGLIVGWAPF